MGTAKMNLNATERKDKPEDATASIRERELAGEERVLYFLETGFGRKQSQWAGVLSYRDKETHSKQKGECFGGGR